MIVDLDHDDMSQAQDENPPSYDSAVDNQPNYGLLERNKTQTNVKQPEPNQNLVVFNAAGPSYTSQPLLRTPLPTVYHYTNPHTHEHVTSLLPPDHPEMICLQAGEHMPQTKYGLLGILVAVFWFPLGIGLCLLDRRVMCTRCGLHIDDGICG